MTPGEKQRHDQQIATLKHGLEQCTARRNELGRELQAVTKICAEVRTRLKESVATLAQHVDALSAGRAVEQGLREEIARLTEDRDYFKASYSRKLDDERKALETAAAEQQKNTLLLDALLLALHQELHTRLALNERCFPVDAPAVTVSRAIMETQRRWTEVAGELLRGESPSPSESPAPTSDKALICQPEHGTARVLIDGEYQCACAACAQHREGASRA